MSSFDCPARGQRGRVPRRRGARPPSPLATACVPPRRRSTMRSFEGAGPPPLQRDHRRQGFSVARRSETRSPRPRCRRRRRPRRAGGDRSAGRRLWRRRGVGDDEPKGDEALGSAVMRGRFAGRRKEHARRLGDRDRATGRPKASRVRPCAAGRGGGRRGETMSRRRGDAGRRMSEAEMVLSEVRITRKSDSLVKKFVQLDFSRECRVPGVVFFVTPKIGNFHSLAFQLGGGPPL